MQNEKICTVCGNSLDIWDQNENYGFHRTIGYGSVHDGDRIDIDVCCKCFDRIIDELVLPICKTNPITEIE